MFSSGAETLLERLGTAADDTGDLLEAGLWDLTQKIEVGLSLLWEDPSHDPSQVRARREAVYFLNVVAGQVALWTEAERKDV